MKRTRRLFRQLIIVLGLIFLTSSLAQAASVASYTDLSTLAADISGSLREKTGTGKFFLSRDNIKDALTGETANFSLYLARELESALSAAGFALAPFYEQAENALAVTWQQEGERVVLFVYCEGTKNDGVRHTIRFALDRRILPPDSFADTLDIRASRLSSRLLQNKRGLRIYVNPVVEKRRRYGCEFSEYLTLKLRTGLAASPYNEVLEEKPVMRSLENTRALQTKAKALKNLASSEAFYADANAVLEGFYLTGDRGVHVNLVLKDLQGRVLNSADDTIPRSLIFFSLNNDGAAEKAEIMDTALESDSGMVRIGTTKGGRYQIYREGETLRFLLQVAKPLHVYLYNINPNNTPVILYPRAGSDEGPLQVGTLYTIPTEADTWEVVVTPPFGTETVKIFACTGKLPIPILTDKTASRSFADGKRVTAERGTVQDSLADRKEIHWRDLVDYYRGTAKRHKVELYEETLFLQTRQR